MFVVPNFEIIEFTDPICVWSWGSEPILKKLEISYPHNLKISYVTGGLIEDIRIFRDDINDIGGDIEKSNKNLAMYYLDASKVHNMPVCVENIKILYKRSKLFLGSKDLGLFYCHLYCFDYMKA